MLSISKKLDYGLELMLTLAANYQKGPISLKKIARSKKLPYRFLGQIVIPLKEAKLIAAKEGVKGGYYLLQPPSKIDVSSVISTLRGRTPKQECDDCERQKVCQVHDIWTEVTTEVKHSLKDKTLKDYLQT